MSQYKIKYRASGMVDFEFTFAWMRRESSWRVYIDRQPAYGRRPAGAVATHRLGLPRRAYICWDKPLRTYEDARSVAALWADCTQHYIATGVFGPPPNRRRVHDGSTYAGLTEQQLRNGSVSSQISTSAHPDRPVGPIRRLLERLG